MDTPQSVRFQQIYGLQGAECNNQWETISKTIWGTYINCEKRTFERMLNFQFLNESEPTL